MRILSSAGLSCRVLIVVTIGVALFAKSTAADSLAPGIKDTTVALWLFDEPIETPNRGLLEDWTKHGNDLTLQPGAHIAPGRFGNALEIIAGGERTAVRRYIDSTGLNLGDEDWTWEFWLQMKAAALAGDVLFQMRQGPFDKGPISGLSMGEKGERIEFVCEGAEIKQTLKTSPDVFLGRAEGWHHIAFTYAASSRKLTHWVNGKQLDSVTLAAAPKRLNPNGENNLCLGADVNGWHALPAYFDEVRVSSAVVYEQPFAPPESFAPPREPLELGAGPHLFVDDGLIAESQHVVRTTHSPERRPEPLIREREIRPGWTQQCGGNTVLYDPESKKFKLWMCVKNVGFPEPDFYASTYWESDDGIHWKAPELGALEFDGHRRHNIIMTGRLHNLRFHSDGILDEGPHAKDPSRRYKVGYFALDWRQDHTNGFNVAFSPDGIHWKHYKEKSPVLRHWPVDEGYPGAGITVADVNDLYYDRDRDLYIQTYKTYALPYEYSLSPVRITGRWREVNDVVRGFRRIVGLCTSKDFIHWEGLQRIIVPDDNDPPELQFYGLGVYKRGDLYIGFLPCLDDEAGGSGDGVGWMELATSRDLYHWQRHRDVFFDRNQDPTAWDSSIAWHRRPIVVGDETWFYYGGMGSGHKTGKREWGLAKMRRDGFVSRDAGDQPATLRTVSFTAPIAAGSRLVLNAAVRKRGSIKVGVTDADGEPVNGYSSAQCLAVTDDAVVIPVQWQRASELPDLTEKKIRLEFVLENASLYGFEFVVPDAD